jgi:hypothetical protein
MSIRRLGAAALTLFVFGACTDRSEGPRTPNSGPSLGAPDVPWAKKTREERMAYMGAHVLPAMKKVFQKHDPKAYEGFGCATCHGADAEAVDYEMPNDLYALPEGDPVAEAMEYDEEVANFMTAEVAPAMERLLARGAGAKGESCFTCHPKE